MSDGSSLPPLDPKGRGQSNQGDDTRPNIMQMYPRIQTLEKEVKSVREQLPMSLNKTVLTLRQSIQSLKDRFSSDASFDEFEGKVNLEIDLEIEQMMNSIKSRLAAISKTETEEREIVESSEVEFDRKFSSFEDLLAQQNRRNEQRLRKLEQMLTKVVESPEQNNSGDAIMEITESVKDQDIKLAELTRKMADIEKSLAPPPPKKQENEEEKKEEKNEKKIPDLTVPLQNLRAEFAKFKADYSEQLSHARQNVQEARDRLGAVKSQIVGEVKDAVSEIEFRIVEMNNLCESLNAQIYDINRSMAQNANQRMLESVALQIKAAQESIQSDLAAMRTQIKRFEIQKPLVPTNL